MSSQPVNRRLARQVLLAPGLIRKAAATQARTPEERWILAQPKEVRESYVREVLDGSGDEQRLQEIWMLRQSDPVRESYVREVLDGAP